MGGVSNPLVLGPIIIPLFGAATCLLLAHNNRLQRIIALAAGIAAALASIAVLLANQEAGPAGVQIYRLGGWATPIGIVLVADKMAALFAVMGTVVVTAGLLYCLQCHDRSLNYPVF